MMTVQVSPAHIEAMLAAAESYGVFSYPGGGAFSFYHHGERHCLCRSEELAAFGRVLWETNAAAVRAGYPYDDRSSRSAARMGVFQDLGGDPRFHPDHQRTPSPIETLKLCACYRYQACECEAWESSEAAAFIDALEHCAIVALPGYDAAPWEWSR